jgi:hypothetical protein
VIGIGDWWKACGYRVRNLVDWLGGRTDFDAKRLRIIAQGFNPGLGPPEMRPESGARRWVFRGRRVHLTNRSNVMPLFPLRPIFPRTMADRQGTASHTSNPGAKALGYSVIPFHGGEPASQRLQHGSQIHNRLVLTNSVTAFCQQSGLNRSQIVKVEHLFGDRVDQDLAKLKEKR